MPNSDVTANYRAIYPEVRTSQVLLPELAAIMQKLGCTEAMALDGGGSTSMAYDGKCIIATRRRLANVLAVVQRPAEEANARVALAQQKADELRRQAEALAAAQRPTPPAAHARSTSILAQSALWPYLGAAAALILAGIILLIYGIIAFRTTHLRPAKQRSKR